VKNISRPVRTWRVLIGGRDATAPDTRPAMGMPFKPSIAVLPFNNMSGDPEQEFFADGLAEDLITALSRIHWLFVSARNSSFTFKGAGVSVGEVARVLGVRYVVEGSVRKAGNRIRITAQLIDAETGNHVWAARFDREISDIFAIQDEISEAFAAAIEPEIGQVERERARRKAPDSLDCWEHYQRGLWHLYKFTATDNAEAKCLLRHAIDLDPEFGPAHTGLGYAYFLDTIMGFGGGSDRNIQDSYRAIRQAIALDDRDALAHYTLGRLYMLLGDPEQSRAQSQRAVELNPSLAVAHFGLGHAMMLVGEAEQGIAEFDAAIRLSPRDPVLWAFEYAKATALILLGRYDEAVEWARRATRHPTAGVWAYIALASALGHVGERDHAQTALAELLEIKPDFTLTFIKSYLPFNRETDFERYVAGLIKAGFEPRSA
jgi:adenylate cyclase